MPGFLAALGDGGKLEDGVTARPLNSAPDFSDSRQGPAPKPRPRPSAPPRQQVREPEAEHRPAEERPQPTNKRPENTAERERPPRPEPASDRPKKRADKGPAPRPERASERPQKRAAETGPVEKPFKKPGFAMRKAETGGKRPEKTERSGPAKPWTKKAAPGKRPGPAAADRTAASDTSKRYTPPKSSPKGKPLRGPASKRTDAGNRPPKRPKS